MKSPAKKRSQEGTSSTKRAQQNRIAQRNFREKQSETLRNLKEKAARADALEIELEALKQEVAERNIQLAQDMHELQKLRLEREEMIGLMDRLRENNTFLRSSSARFVPPVEHIRTLPHQHTIKGNFGRIYKPPQGQVSGNPLPWTSHRHTFVDGHTSTSAESISEEHSIVSSEEKVSFATHHPQRRVSMPVNSQVYPGFPKWTPPTLLSKPAKLGTKRNQVPQPPPYHLSFCYTDQKHTTQKAAQHVHPPHLPNLLFSNPMLGDSFSSQPTQLAQDNFLMPFLPSSNLMAGMYHHMPFDNQGVFEFNQLEAGPMDDIFLFNEEKPIQDQDMGL